MCRANYQEQTDKRIARLASGTVFTASDFADIADAKTIFMSFTRLANEGKVAKVMRGVYMKPRYSSFLHENIPPRVDDVAHAIARNYGWNIVPSGVTALNILGLSTQVPASWEYVSDGPYKTYGFNDISIRFRHTNKNTELTQVSHKTAVLIQALKALSKDRVDEDAIRILSAGLTAEEKQTILKEAQYCTAWIYEIIKKICEAEIYARG